MKTKFFYLIFVVTIAFFACDNFVSAQKTKRRKSAKKLVVYKIGRTQGDPTNGRTDIPTIEYDAPPPPRALPNEADESVWNEYDDAKIGFSVLFPNKKQEITNSEYQDFQSFATRTEKAQYSLITREFNLSLEGAELNAFYESVISKVKNPQTTKIISTKDVYLNGIIGKEIVDEEPPPVGSSEPTINFSRIFLLPGKMLILSTTLKKKNYAPDFDKYVYKFFDSLKATNKPLVTELPPKNITGFVKDGVYQNDFFGFTLKIPKDWNVSNSEEQLYAKEAGKQAMQGSSAAENTAIENSVNRANILLMITKEPFGTLENATLSIATEVYPFKSVNESEIAKATSTLLLDKFKKSGYIKQAKLSRDVFEIKINGKTFAGFEIEAELQTSKSYLRMYLSKQKNYLMAFSLGYSKAGDLPILENALKTVKFSDGKTGK